MSFNSGNIIQTDGLKVTDLHKSFGETQALDGVSFTVRQGEIVAVLGPSGCGKSTLLNIIAGLVIHNKGKITWNGKPLNGMPPHKRGFGLMFQDYLLFPHKNVGENIAFGLTMTHWSKERIEARVSETLELINLNGYAKRDVNTLSGGEQQRVALARSLAPYPRLLMLDEPLGSLDRTLRESLLEELGSILNSMQQTALYVTHDQEEAFSLADKVIVMGHGRVAQIGTPQEIFRQPSSEFVARFLGLSNIVEGHYQNGWLTTEIGQFEITDWKKLYSTITQPLDRIENLQILIRPDAVRLDGIGTHNINGEILDKRFRGSLCRLTIQIDSKMLVFEFQSAVPLPNVGSFMNFSFNPEEAFQILS